MPEEGPASTEAESTTTTESTRPASARDYLKQAFESESGAASEESTETETEEVVEAPAAEDTDPFDDDKIQTFDRKYVEKLRREAAARRDEAKRFKEAFKGWPEADQNVLIEVVKLAAENPAEGADLFRQIASALSPEQKAALEREAAVPDGDEEDDEERIPLTKEDLEKFYREQKAKEQADSAVENVFKEAEGFGYKRGTAKMRYLLSLAHENRVSIADAHAQIEAEKQAVIDEYVASKKKEADGAGVLSGGSSPSKGKPIKDFRDAKAALKAMLEANG